MRSLLSRGTLFAFLLLVGCKPSAVDGPGLEEYIQNPSNGLMQVKYSQEIQVQATYLPPALLAVREANGQPASVKEFQQLERKYSEAVYFVLEFSRNRQEVLQPQADFSAYSSLLQTLAFRMGDHVRLIPQSGDTLSPSNTLLDRAVSSNAATRVLVAFPKQAFASEVTLVMQEFGLGTGDVVFHFQRQDILDVPESKLSH